MGLDDILDGVFGSSALGGLGVTALAVAAVVGAPRAKPLAKQAIKGYLTATQRVREWTAESSEKLQDLYAEAKYEFETGLSETSDGEAEADVPKSPGRSRRRPATAGQPA